MSIITIMGDWGKELPEQYKNIEIVQGATFLQSVRFVHSDGETPIAFSTNAQAWMTIKRNWKAQDYLAFLKSANASDVGSNGTIRFDYEQGIIEMDIAHTVTALFNWGKGYYDLSVFFAVKTMSGNRQVMYSPLRGEARLVRSLGLVRREWVKI